MTFFNSIKMCYMKSFDFKGRASKSEYWWFWLVQVPITFIALGTWNSEKFDVLSGVFLGITIASIPANLSSMISFLALFALYQRKHLLQGEARRHPHCTRYAAEITASL